MIALHTLQDLVPILLVPQRSATDQVFIAVRDSVNAFRIGLEHESVILCKLEKRLLRIVNADFPDRDYGCRRDDFLIPRGLPFEQGLSRQ